MERSLRAANLIYQFVLSAGHAQVTVRDAAKKLRSTQKRVSKIVEADDRMELVHGGGVHSRLLGDLYIILVSEPKGDADRFRDWLRSEVVRITNITVASRTQHEMDLLAYFEEVHNENG